MPGIVESAITIPAWVADPVRSKISHGMVTMAMALLKPDRAFAPSSR